MSRLPSEAAANSGHFSDHCQQPGRHVYLGMSHMMLRRLTRAKTTPHKNEHLLAHIA